MLTSRSSIPKYENPTEINEQKNIFMMNILLYSEEA